MQIRATQFCSLSSLGLRKRIKEKYANQTHHLEVDVLQKQKAKISKKKKKHKIP